MTHYRACLAPHCSSETSSTTRMCWEHRPAPAVTRNGDRILIGAGPALLLSTAAARDLALADRKSVV